MTAQVERWRRTLASGNPKRLTDAELKRALAVARSKGGRVHLLIRVLAETGCRISEALALDWDALQQDQRLLILPTLKRRRPAFRAVPVSEGLCKLWQEVREQEGGAKPFPFSRMTAYRYVRDVLEEVGVERKRAHPHVFHHSFAFRAVRAGVPLLALQKLMGHASPDTTAIYYNAMPEDLRDYLEKMNAVVE